jgi:hypothetical protein
MLDLSATAPPHTPPRPPWVIAVLVCVMWTLGCDGVDGLAAGIERGVKQHTTAKTKTGMLRGLEVVERAHQVAERRARRADPDCRLSVDSDEALTYRASIELERRSAHGVERLWREERTFRRDRHGHLAATMSGEWTDQLGLQARREMQWRLIDQHSWVSVDGRAFYRRAADAEDARHIELAGLAPLQTLLDASDGGWSESATDAEQQTTTWSAGGGGERLICGPSSEEAAGWLKRLGTDAVVTDAELIASGPRLGSTASAATRTLSIEWQLDQGSVLVATLDDRLSLEAAPVESPDPEAVVDVRRDRSLHHVDRLVAQMLRDGAIDSTDESDTASEDATR